MKKSSNPEKDIRPKAALLWDESFLWGLMSYKALCENSLPFDLIRSSDIRAGNLKNYTMLFVPGGWASNKIKSLGVEGVSGIRKFIEEGGNYLGFCGGAGLATLDGIGLINVKRRPTKERVPSFSGRIRLDVKDHPIWKSALENAKCKMQNAKYGSQITDHRSPAFHAWWPSQFVISDDCVDVLASYAEALPDSFSSDLNVGDVSANCSWADLEKLYGINLDPVRLLGEPAVVEGRCGKGKVVLSLLHFDTPGDFAGYQVLRNLWKYLDGACEDRPLSVTPSGGVAKMNPLPGGDQVVGCSSHQRNGRLSDSGSLDAPAVVSELQCMVEELISLGLRNFLWFWRNPMLLQWRRGVRGLEYCTLYVMVKEIAVLIRAGYCANDLGERLHRIDSLLTAFVNDAMRLLLMERTAMQNGQITYEKCDAPEIGQIRTRLFSNSKSHGGLFKELVDEIDGVLFSLLLSARAGNTKES